VGLVRLWVPETLFTSRDLLIFVEEAAEAVVSFDLGDVGRCAVGERPCGGCLPQTAVRTMIIVVALELAQHGCGVSLVDDEKAVEEFAADGADEAFRDGVCARCAHRRLEDLDVDSGEHGVEGSGELAVAVADEESEVPVGVVEVHEQVAGLLGEPGCGRVGGDAEDVDAGRVACSMTKSA